MAGTRLLIIGGWLLAKKRVKRIFKVYAASIMGGVLKLIILSILLCIGFSNTGITENTGISCEGASKDAVLTVAKPGDEYFRIVCTMHGHIIHPKFNVRHPFPDTFKPTIFPAQMVKGSHKKVYHKSYFKSIAVTEVNQAYASKVWSEHDGLLGKTELSTLVGLELISSNNQGKKHTVYIFNNKKGFSCSPTCLKENVFSYVETFGRIEGPALSTDWVRMISKSKNDVSKRIIRTNDGGYLALGETNVNADSSADIWAVKISTSGDKQWDRTYGKNKLNSASDIISTKDDGYLIVGKTRSSGSEGEDMWVVKTDGLGEVQWDKSYDRSGLDTVKSVVETIDGGFLLVGNTYSRGSTGDDVWIVKIDQLGNEIWKKTYGGSGWEKAGSLIGTSDGSFVIAGTSASNDSKIPDAWVFKIGSSGELMWEHSYGGDHSESAKSLVATKDGGYLFVGDTWSKGAGGTDMWVVKVDAQGNQQWDHTFGGTGYDTAERVIARKDGSYLIAGNTKLKVSRIPVILVVSIEFDGTLLWEHKFGGGTKNRVKDIITSNDGGYLLLGDAVPMRMSSGYKVFNTGTQNDSKFRVVKVKRD